MKEKVQALSTEQRDPAAQKKTAAKKRSSAVKRDSAEAERANEQEQAKPLARKKAESAGQDVGTGHAPEANLKEPAKLAFENHDKLIVKQGINDKGSHVLFFLNYSDEEMTVKNISGDAADLLQAAPVKKDESFTLSPWGVVILEY